MKKTSLFFLFLVNLTAIIINPFPYVSSSLNLTVKTDKPSYNIGEYVCVYGNLTLNNTTVQDGLIALEVNDPYRTLVVRTLTTNTTPTADWLVNVTDVTPCDEYGNPKESFQKETLAYFNVTVSNNDIEMRWVLVTANIYDESQAPLGVAGFQGVVKENSTFSVIMGVPIPETAETGNATVYANAYSEWPRIGGKPYCPEQSETFEITNGSTQTSSPPIKEQEIEGNYNTTLKLSFGEPLGTYTIHVTSIYQGQTATNSTQFEVNIQGDANGDGSVDGSDFFIFLQAWGTSPPSDPRADFTGDGTVDGSDFFILLQNWGYGA